MKVKELRADQLRPGMRLFFGITMKWEELRQVEHLENGQIKLDGILIVDADSPFRAYIPNARFLVFWNGQYTKLTIKPDEQLTFWTSGPTDEGYALESQTYYYDVDDMAIESSLHSRQRDCDGTHEDFREFSCRWHELKSYVHELTEIDVVRLPEWEDGESSCRDEFAELSGY
jgi:hypothetical protein